MKDKEAREDIYDTKVRVQFLEQVKPKIFAKYCEKCKHDTAQMIEINSSDTSGMSACTFRIGDFPIQVAEQTRCLNCGPLWECKKQTVCKEVK